MPPLEGAQTLRQILCGSYLLRIPDYQRDYAWSASEVQQLFGDVVVALPSKWRAPEATCYLHSILLNVPPSDDAPPGPAAGSESSSLTEADIVDGQQRLVTLTMLIACLRDRFADVRIGAELEGLITRTAKLTALPADRYALTARGAGGEFLRTYIQPRGATALPLADGIAQSHETRLLAEARAHLLKRVAAMAASDAEALARVLLDRCYLSRVVVSSREDWRIFVQVNDRGVELSQGDRVKSELVGAIDASERSDFLKIWETHKSMLGPDFEGGGNRRYLLNYISLLFGAPRFRTVVDRILARADEMGPTAFMRDVFDPASSAYRAIVRCSYDLGTPEENARIGEYLTFARWLGEALPSTSNAPRDFWLPPVLVGMMACGRDAKRTLDFLHAFDRYAYGVTILHGQDKNAISLIEALTDRFKALPDGEALERLLQPPDTKATRSNLEKSLGGVVAKLILTRLHAELTPGDVSVHAVHLSPDHDIEHVLPQSLKDPWPKLFGGRQGARAHVEVLGNKYVVLTRDNRVLGNLGWTIKRQMMRTMTTLLPLPESVRAAEVWNKDAIANRHRQLIEVADRIWGFATTVRTTRPQAKSKPKTAPKKVAAVPKPIAAKPSSRSAARKRRRAKQRDSATVNRPILQGSRTPV